MFQGLRRRREALGGAAAALVAGASSAARAETDPLVIDKDAVKVGTLDGSRPDGAIVVKHGLNFGNQLAPLLTLWDPTHTIGIQNATMYFRTDKNFAWYQGGAYTSGELDAGGGTKAMSLSNTELSVAGTVKAQAFETASGVSLAAVQNAVNILIPVGTIMAYGGDTRMGNVVAALKSQGWLPCDGAVYSAQEYPELSKVIGNSFGSLRVPDLRGRFLRGVNQGTGRDPDAGSRRSENGGSTGDNVGSVQDDEFRSHTHQYQLFPGDRGGIASGQYWTAANAQTGPAGGSETRPKNVYVNWIIRAK
jgi:microcystin-dependent protein